jgi:hypothetical protein
MKRAPIVLLVLTSLVNGGCGLLFNTDELRGDGRGDGGTPSSGGEGGNRSGGGGSGGATGGGGSVSASVGGSGGCFGNEVPCGNDCVDTTTNDNHCGACDHDCGGGACEESVCQPFELVSGQYNIHGLTLDETRAYFTTSSFLDGPNDVVAAVPKEGGALTIFSDQEAAAQHVIVVGERVYWTTWDEGEVRSAPLDHSEGVRTEWSGGFAAFGIQSRGNQVVFSLYNQGLAVFSIADASPPPVTLIYEPQNDENFALFALDPFSDDNIVFTVPNSAQGVRRYSPSANSQPLTSSDYNTWGVTQDASYYYYSDQGADASNGKLHRISKTTWQAEEMANGLNRPRGLAVDADYVYVAEIDTVRRVSVNPIDNGSFASSLLAPAQEATMIAVDEKFIYWTNYGAFGGTLLKLAKPL